MRMIWVYLALLYRIILTGYERLVVKKLGHEADSLGGAFLFNITAVLVLLPFSFFIEIPSDFGFVKWGILSGLMYAIANNYYLRAYQGGEVSLVSPLYYFSTFFVLILSVTFLHETLTGSKILGTVLLVYGASMLSSQKNIFKALAVLVRDPHCAFMMVCSLFTSFGRVIDGGVVKSAHPFWYALTLYVFVSLYLGVFILVKKKTKSMLHLVKAKPGTAFLSGFLNSTTYLCGLYTFSKLEVSVAEPLSMISMVVTVLLGYWLLKENIKRRLLAVLIIFLGAWFLF